MKDIRILLVEDSRALRKIVSAYFTQLGWKVEDSTGLPEARLQVESTPPDLVILDIDTHPEEARRFISDLDRDGIETIVLSESARVDDRIDCLERGALDFLTKPVDLRELSLRLKRLWRARARSNRPAKMELRCGGAVLDIASRTLRGAHARPVLLTPSEFRLLYLLLKNEGRIVERALIARDVLGHAEANASRSVDVMVSKLRRKLGTAGSERFIRNVRSEGYVLVWNERHTGRGTAAPAESRTPEPSYADET